MLQEGAFVYVCNDGSRWAGRQRVEGQFAEIIGRFPSRRPGICHSRNQLDRASLGCFVRNPASLRCRAGQ